MTGSKRCPLYQVLRYKTDLHGLGYAETRDEVEEEFFVDVTKMASTPMTKTLPRAYMVV